MTKDLIVPAAEGLCCPPGNFYIDPWRPVALAVITHAHSDHTRWGSRAYLCHEDCAPILRKRLGDVRIETLRYGESREIGKVRLSLNPAGHVLGSAQVRIEHRGEVWVASGDYKLEADGVSAPFEPVRCDAFITESTFGLPIYRWRPQAEVMGDINAWWAENARAGRASVMQAYGLGKAQRLLRHLDPNIGPIVCHGAIEPLNQIHRDLGVALPPTLNVTALDKAGLARCFALAPHSAIESPWIRRFGVHSDAFASGWMQLRGNRRRLGVDQGFALSDHADWPGLLQAIAATGAERIFVTHGSDDALSRYLREKGYDARPMATEYGDEEGEAEPAGEVDTGGA
ncbi:ligase-associated DNA damage response exonuclease [Methylocystis sp.]|uniref:ligase-associated DNA damage response exonuclease n=1 Tax=Methylocystis sp. TaxID=1911079 RepID=UPI0025DC3509|nr:ligase-associated DNA damage response exonuclease [Methylocystis sp.]